MPKKRVTFDVVCEYDAEKYPELTDSDFEAMAVEDILQNPETLNGTVETLSEDAERPYPSDAERALRVIDELEHRFSDTGLMRSASKMNDAYSVIRAMYPADTDE